MDTGRILLAILVVAVILYMWRRQSGFDLENYTKEPASLDKLFKMSSNGLVKMYPFDHQSPRKYTLEREGDKFFKIRGEFPGENKSYYLAVKDKVIFHMTSTAKPQGETRWRLMESITDDDGYYSIASGDSEVYLYINISAGEAGVINLKNKEDAKSLSTMKALNFAFTNPDEKISIPPIKAS